MSRILRKFQKIFAGSAANNGQFGSGQLGTKVTSTDLDVLQNLSAFGTGWLSAIIGASKFPPLEEFQALHYITTTQLAYFFQEGMPAWDTSTTYFVRSLVKDPASLKIYASITDNNQGNALTDATKWRLAINMNSGAPVNSLSHQLLTTSGTYTPSAGMQFSLWRGRGGGGGGGSAPTTSTNGVGGGGGAGGEFYHLLTAADIAGIGGTLAYTIGAGGAGGTNNTAGASGATGGATAAGGQTANGGTGGASNGIPGDGFSISGNGGTASGGNIYNNTGAAGLFGLVVSGVSHGGAGANGFQGNGGAPTTGQNVAGDDATGYGAGGGGGSNNSGTKRNGGAGSSGVIEVLEFCAA